MDTPHLAKIEDTCLHIQPLKFWQNWLTVRYMFRNYPTGLDAAWDAEVRGILRRVFKRFVDVPFYLAFKNEGYSLRLGSQLVGLLYLQHPPLVTHINDIEINAAYRRQGYSRRLLDFAEQRAHQLNKKYMTLAVTLSNKRAFNIYTRNGYLEQHDHFYQLQRWWWSESQPAPLVTSAITTSRYQLEVKAQHPTLRRLGRAEAEVNLLRFFKLETEITNPLTGEVWLRHYPPQLPTRKQGRSYALSLSVRSEKLPESRGQADLFEYGDWLRWRLYLDPTRWDAPAIKALLELLIDQTDRRTTLTIAFGSSEMHNRAQSLARELGLQERASERTLMIKIL